MKTNNLLRSALIAALLYAPATAGKPLPRSTPEAQGVSSQAILEFTNTLDQRFDGIHSLMIVRDGQVIAEGWWTPYGAEHNHILFSLSKSFTSTAVGLAVAEGLLDIDDAVIDFFPEQLPEEVSDNLKSMRVRDILTMSTGHGIEPSPLAVNLSVKNFLRHPVPHQPGTHFQYNSAATFMQSAIVQKLTGKTILEYLGPRLFEPLGIENPAWVTNAEGISLGGYGLRVRTEDIAKLGQLYLQKGQWNGKTLLPAYWITQATAKQESNGNNPTSDWNQGYGFQFWRCRHNAYRGDGAFSQYCIVIPEKNTVVAMTSGVGDMQSVLNVVWDQLLPALGSEELSADAEAQQRLRKRLNKLSVKYTKGEATSAIAQQIENRRFEFPTDEQKISNVMVSPGDSDERIVLTLNWEGRELKIPAGYRHWKKGRAAYPSMSLSKLADEPVAGTFAWPADDTLVVKFCAYETPYQMTFTLKFDDDQVTLKSQSNVSFGPTEQKPLRGQATKQ